MESPVFYKSSVLSLQLSSKKFIITLFSDLGPGY